MVIITQFFIFCPKKWKNYKGKYVPEYVRVSSSVMKFTMITEDENIFQNNVKIIHTLK